MTAQFVQDGAAYALASGFMLGADIFTTSIIVPKALFTGVPLISSLNVTAANAAGNFTATGGLNNGFGGVMTIDGNSVVGVLGGLINLSVPLNNAGVGGTTVVGAAALQISITGHIWTTASAPVMSSARAESSWRDPGTRTTAAASGLCMDSGRTSARTRRPWSSRDRTIAPPMKPVAPVTATQGAAASGVID